MSLHVADLTIAYALLQKHSLLNSCFVPCGTYWCILAQNRWNSHMRICWTNEIVHYLSPPLSYLGCFICLLVCLFPKQTSLLAISGSLYLSISKSIEATLYRFCIASASNQQRNGKGIRVFHFSNMRSLLQTFFCTVFESISYTFDIIRLALVVWEYPNAYCCLFSRTVRLETSVSCLVRSLSHSYNITITLKQFIYQIGSVLTANPRKRNLFWAGCLKYG